MLWTLILTIFNTIFSFFINIIGNIFVEISSLVLSPAILATYVTNLNQLNEVFPVYSIIYFASLGLTVEIGLLTFTGLRSIVKFIYRV